MIRLTGSDARCGSPPQGPYVPQNCLGTRELADPGSAFRSEYRPITSAVLIHPVATGKRLRETLERLAAAEERAFACEFLAPMLRGGVVQVRIAGVVCRLKMSPTTSWAGASSGPYRRPRPNWSGRPRLAERRQYLELLPLLRMIVCLREDDRWLAIPAHRADTRFRIEGFVPVRLVEEAQLFEVSLARGSTAPGSGTTGPTRAAIPAWRPTCANRSAGWSSPTIDPSRSDRRGAGGLPHQLCTEAPGRDRGPARPGRGTAPRRRWPTRAPRSETTRSGAMSIGSPTRSTVAAMFGVVEGPLRPGRGHLSERPGLAIRLRAWSACSARRREAVARACGPRTWHAGGTHGASHLPAL